MKEDLPACIQKNQASKWEAETSKTFKLRKEERSSQDGLDFKT